MGTKEIPVHFLSAVGRARRARVLKAIENRLVPQAGEKPALPKKRQFSV